MKVVFFGTPDFAVATLEAVIAAGHEVIGVVTQPDRPRGRKNQMEYSEVKVCACAHGLRVYQPERVRDEADCKSLAALCAQADVGIVVAFGQIMPQTILDAPRLGCLNVHASLLPAYRGAAPIQWAILDGLAETGVTIMQMDAGLDTGDILAQRKIKLAPDETGGSLFARLSALGAELLTETLPKLEAGEITPQKQGETTTAYAKMMQKDMGRIDWTRPAAEIERYVRGLNPWPSAYTRVNGKTLKIWRALVTPGEGTPGQIAELTKDTLCIQCGTDRLSLLEVQMEGKRRMEIAEFLRGMRQIRIGE